MNLHVINYILDRAPWPSSVFSTSSVDASKILAFVSPWFFADLGVLLFFCVIMGISGRNQEELQATGHLEPGWSLCLSDEQDDGFGNSQMLPEIASLKGKMMSGLLFLATGLFSRWEDRLPLKLQGSGSSTCGEVPPREAVFLRAGSVKLQALQASRLLSTWQASQILALRKPLCVESGQCPLEITSSTNHGNCQRQLTLTENG